MKDASGIQIPKYGRFARGMTADEAEEPEKKQRIKIWMGACMVIVALSIDGIQAFLTFLGIGLVFNPIISVGADFVFWLWFMLLGVSFTKSPKKLATFGFQSIIEFIPGFDAVPAFTAGTIITIIITRSEDKGGIISKIADAVPMPKK